MNFFQKVFYFFSRYTDPAERRVGKFFRRVREQDSPQRLEKSLVRLLQHDIAVINLWTEHRYKGYDYLTKRKRKRLYENLAAIKADFAAFAATQTIDLTAVLAQIEQKGVDTTKLRLHPEQLAHIVTIMRYLSPARGRYIYRASSSFGRLLRDPAKEVLEGDCNQIVTLYIALYGTKHNVADLSLTLYPGHVALHLDGVDIETTNGTFAHYAKEGQTAAPIHEIVSVNLLDTTDTNFTKSTVDPEVFLQAARLAYVVSSHRQLVKKNLEIAYRQTASHLMKSNDYPKALTYARQSKDQELIATAGHNGALYAMQHNDYVGARRFAEYSLRKTELRRTINHNEAIYHYRAGRYHDALKAYERNNDHGGVKQCYRALYQKEQQKLQGVRTVTDLKAQAGVVRTMERYARASGDTALIKHVGQLTKQL